MPAGWLVRVTTFDTEDTPTLTRYFMVAEPDKTQAEQIAADLGETALTIRPLSQSELDERSVAAGQKQEYTLHTG